MTASAMTASTLAAPAEAISTAAADVESAAPGVDARRRAAFRRLQLTEFRSYPRLDVAFDGRPAYFVGANGAGKTNLLEALSLFGPGRGLRGARLDDLGREGGSASWAVAAEFDEADGETNCDDDLRRLGVGLGAGAAQRGAGGASRVCRIDGASARGPIAFADLLRFSWLTPAQDGLFTAAAGERRKFLDRIAQTRDASHARAAGDFEAVARQRQRLLDERRFDDGWLTALETSMAEAGVAVAAARREASAALAAHDASGLAGGAFPAAEIALEGDLEAALDAAPAADVEDDYISELKARRRLDAEAGRATMGPHRSDMIVRHRAKGTLARLCSTGEQKALLIGLVLANACALAKGPRAAPLILLFDEIAAHLDPGRRAALFDVIDGVGFQCFMTGTDENLFEAWGGRAQGFRVDAGAVEAISGEG